jgi:hypothetical protein
MKPYKFIPVKPCFNFRFILLLAAIILVQQFSFAAHSIFFFHNNSTALYQYTEKKSGQNGSSRVSLGVDVELSDEDEVHDPQGYPERSLNSDEVIALRLYTLLINNHYLRLAWALRNQSDPPLFVLYHSWKAHLS